MMCLDVFGCGMKLTTTLRNEQMNAITTFGVEVTTASFKLQETPTFRAATQCHMLK